MPSQTPGKSRAKALSIEEAQNELDGQMAGQLAFDGEGFPMSQEQLVMDILVDMGYNRR